MLNIDRDKVSVLIAKFAHEVGAIVSIFFPGLIIPDNVTLFCLIIEYCTEGS